MLRKAAPQALRRGWPLAAAAALVICTPGAALAQPGPAPLDGRRLVAWKCNACHRSVRATESRKTRAEWELTVARMVQNGLAARDDEIKAIIDYLVSLDTEE
jgi:cytochrome c5